MMYRQVNNWMYITQYQFTPGSRECHPRQPGSQHTVAPCAETLAGEDGECTRAGNWYLIMSKSLFLGDYSRREWISLISVDVGRLFRRGSLTE